jgi:DNA-directed RNA polymerase subunit RPC12/RpoP
MLNVLLARCPHCGKLFRGSRSSLSLQEHITNIHAAIAPISKPSLASSPSSTISSLDTLVARPDNDKAYVCSKCKASFMQKDHLEKHELLHSTQGQVRMFHILTFTKNKFISFQFNINNISLILLLQCIQIKCYSFSSFN